MIDRLLKQPLLDNKSFFLFGLRGTGKTYWAKQSIEDALYIDLLESEQYTKYLANPQRLEDAIPKDFKNWIIIDEVQKVPALLDEVHRLIEKYHYKFVLTGSSARRLKTVGVNLLAGRALTYYMYPLTSIELGEQFNIEESLRYGNLPSILTEKDPKKYLASYVHTYLYQEVRQEADSHDLESFARFLEAATFSQGSSINISAVARDCGIKQKIASAYFEILYDYLVATTLPVFTKRSKRRLVSHPKFYYVDVGLYQTLRPRGPLERLNIDGIALETLFFQELRAINDYFDYHYKLYFWRTSNGTEVDFVVYGEKGLHAFEVKSSSKIKDSDYKGLLSFKSDYPEAKCYMIYGGNRLEYYKGINLVPIEQALKGLQKILA